MAAANIGELMQRVAGYLNMAAVIDNYQPFADDWLRYAISWITGEQIGERLKTKWLEVI